MHVAVEAMAGGVLLCKYRRLHSRHTCDSMTSKEGVNKNKG